jgi:uncharacterized membrane protein
MATSVSVGTTPQFHYGIRRVPALRPLTWLDCGWNDLRAIGAAGLAHGALIAILGGILLMLGSSHMYLVAAAVSGYLLVGPIMTTGLCELARRREAHETLSFDDSLQALSRNPDGLLQFGGVLAVLAVLWFVLSAILLATVLNAPAPSLAVALWGGSMLMSSSQLMGYILCGAVLAVIVFVMSTVAVPLLIDRHASAWEAIRTSLQATLTNLPAMLVWAFLIVGLTAIGFLTLLVGMVVLTPLLGYATWHAYRDLIAP